jgi:DNA-binding GntR family transcriptional regulator
MIERGEFPPGTMLPSEKSLAQERSVARGTIRAALAVLQDEGLVEVVMGEGRRVSGEPLIQSSQNAWQQIFSTLQRQLESGRLSGGAPMPSESELMAEFEVSRNTVRRAYKELVDQGLVVVRHGAGAFPRAGRSE